MRPRSVLSLANFFGAAHFFLIIFVITPYLATFLPEDQTSLAVSLGAVFTLIAFPLMPALVIRFRPRVLAIILACAQITALALLSLSPGMLTAVLFIATATGLSPLIAYQLDLLLEATVENEGSTGRIRTAFLTAGNIALIIAPLLVGLLLDSTDAYARVFLVAAASLVPFVFLLSTNRLPQGQLPTLSNMRNAALCIWGDSDLRAVSLANFMLQFFYHLAPLFIPLYLHTALGMPWSTLGWVFTVMLLPFVFIEYPAGILADKKLGDKELMATGFVIMGIAFGSIALIDTATNLITVVVVLVLTRVGAAFVEAMVEGHFFRRVSERDANSVGVYRMMRPVAALSAPIIGSLLLFYGGYPLLFILSGLIVLSIGAASAMAITDIR